MSKATERVLATLQQLLTEQTQVATADIAARMGVSRSVTSHYLSDLLQAGLVKKGTGRPVYWQLTSTVAPVASAVDDLHSLAAVIGANGSQRESIRKCIAAVAYPGGLNIVITGHSGVGKTFLAQQIYRYAKDTGALAKTAPYKVLNCADYANNPELFSSILFGYVKGAFTGANANKPGLLQEADGGYLFLDEVHRLSGENQEKLFTFMDTGRFRPIGENQHDSTASVRFIFATTEDPHTAMLETFNRRVPVNVHLTAYAHRPINERLAFIKVLFGTEAKNFKCPIQVAPEALTYLLNLKPDGNVGRLKNMIKVACAKASTRKTGAQLVVAITDFDREASRVTTDNLNITQPLIVGEQASDTVFELNTASPAQHFEAYLTAHPELTAQAVRTQLQTLYQLNGADTGEDSVLHAMHARQFRQVVVDQFGLKAALDYEPVLFQLYVQNFTLGADSLAAIKRLASHFARSQHVAQAFYAQLPVIAPASHEVLTAILTCCLSETVDETIPLRCLMVAHGSHMATSIQSVVNRLCGTYLVDALDMPIDTTINQIAKRAKQTVADFDTSNGFILLVDMGSLNQLYTQIKSQLQGDLLVVNNLTTATALDIGLKIQQKLPFEAIAEHASTDYTIAAQYFEGFAKNQNIVISCMSGLGISEKLRDIFQEVLGRRISLVTMDFDRLRQSVAANDIEAFESTLLVITTTNLPETFEIPHINIYDLLDASGQVMIHDILKQYVDQKTFDDLYNRLVRFLSIEGVSERLAFLNPSIIIQEVETVIFKFENYYHVKIDGKTKLNLYMHISLMVERLMTGVSGSRSASLQPKDAKEEEFFTVAQGIFKPIELKYGITIDGYELSLLSELFKSILAPA